MIVDGVCRCEMCLMGERITKAQASREPDELLGIVNDLWVAWESTGMDLEVMQLEKQGKWPTPTPIGLQQETGR